MSLEIYDVLYNKLLADDADTGEAAGLAMGLVMLGTASQDKIDKMLEYARETQHEKIIRGLAIGLSLTMYNKEDRADSLIVTLLNDKVWDASFRPAETHKPLLRTPFCDMEVFTQLPWRTVLLAATGPSDSYFILL